MTKVEKNSKKTKDKNDIKTKVDVLNYRDGIYGFIFDAREYLNEFVIQKINKNWDLNSTAVETLHKKFRKNSKEVLANVGIFREKIGEKINKFVLTAKLYINEWIKTQDNMVESKIAKAQAIKIAKVKELKVKLKELVNEKDALLKSKSSHEAMTKEKIKKIRKVLFNDKVHSLKDDSIEIKNLVKDHKKFIEEDIISKIKELNVKVVKIKETIRNEEAKNIEVVFKLTEKSRNNSRQEFKIIAEIEKEVVLKSINFQDLLEDAENFIDDQSKKYRILLKSRQIIKNNTSKEIMRDINSLFSSIADTEKLFDEVNLSFIQTQNKIESKDLNEKLLRMKLNSVSSSNTVKLLGTSLDALTRKGDE